MQTEKHRKQSRDAPLLEDEPFETGTDDQAWSGSHEIDLNRPGRPYSSTSACNVDGRGHC